MAHNACARYNLRLYNFMQNRPQHIWPGLIVHYGDGDVYMSIQCQTRIGQRGCMTMRARRGNSEDVAKIPPEAWEPSEHGDCPCDPPCNNHPVFQAAVSPLSLLGCLTYSLRRVIYDCDHRNRRALVHKLNTTGACLSCWTRYGTVKNLAICQGAKCWNKMLSFVEGAHARWCLVQLDCLHRDLIAIISRQYARIGRLITW